MEMKSIFMFIFGVLCILAFTMAFFLTLNPSVSAESGNSKNSPADSEYRNLEFSDSEKSYSVTGLLGNEIKRNSVSVRNNENTGGYFTVRFYFKNSYGETKTELETKHIPPHKEEKFHSQKIYSNGYRYWKYDVTSQSKVRVLK